jgi:ornithine carbamoyltransferase
MTLPAAPLAHLRNKDFIHLLDLSKADLERLVDLALAMKQGRNKEKYLVDKNIGLIFMMKSTRTRVSFQVATSQLGGHAEQYNAEDMHLSTYETLMDTAAVLGRYLDGIVLRMFNLDQYGQGRDMMQTIAKYADVPVVNALDEKDHPCQVLADLVTLKELFGDQYRQKKLVMTWAYSERYQSPGVLHSMLTAAAILGMNVTFAHPSGYELDEEYLAFARNSGSAITFCNDLSEAAEGADVIYTKSWKSLTLPKADEQLLKEQIRDQWCVTPQHFKLANPGARFMDCMPFIRGQQVAAEVADGAQSVIYTQAENRLHAQKAILASLLS